MLRFNFFLSAVFMMMANYGVAQSEAGILPVCDRTDEVKEFIVTRVNELQETEKSCEEVSVEDLATLERVSVAYLGVEEFQAGDFSGLPNLKILNINGHRSETLPEGLFDGLTQLETLVIISSDLEVYPEDFLAETPNLKNCHCFNNDVTDLSNNVVRRLAGMWSLEILDFDATVDQDIQNRLRAIFPLDGEVQLTFY